METRLSRYLARWPWLAYAVALLLTALVTGAIALVRQAANVGNISMLYLLAVLLTAIAFGSLPAIFASVVSFFAFDYFFIEPTHRLTVSNAEEWVALGVLLVTGVITGELAAALRRRAREAERRRREAVVLYDVVRLMQTPDIREALASVAGRLREELAVAAVVVDFGPQAPLSLRAEAGEADALRIAESSAASPAQILSIVPATGRAASGRWVRVVPPRLFVPSRRQDRLKRVSIQLQGCQVGNLILVSEPDAAPLSSADDRLLLAVSDQLGLAVERSRLREVATEAEVLQRTDELKTALLNAVSHDLKTPLASILASAGSLLQEDVTWTKEERRQFARAIEEDAGYLNRLVTNLLDLSRIEAGALRPDREWHDIGALIEDVLGRLRPLTAGHPIAAVIPEDVPPVPLDYLQIGDVLFNLIENAAKHTPAETEIRVSARRTGGEVQVEVVDKGPGVPAAELQRVFDPFFRAHKRDSRAKGMGLGLAVARGLVEANGGRIWAENVNGGGARFAFTLPLDAAPGENRE
jgi:two-component system sensor histidine kinase KdpD